MLKSKTSSQAGNTEENKRTVTFKQVTGSFGPTQVYTSIRVYREVHFLFTDYFGRIIN